MGEFDPKLRFAQSPVARLATSTPDGTPHLVPAQRLRRLANLEHNPRASVLVDSYADDWTQLWWVRADGVAAIHRDGEVMRAAYRLLRAKYAQYQSVPLNGPVIAIAVQRWASWHA